MSPSEALIIDLDGTLYDSEELDSRNREAAVVCIAKTRSISEALAAELLASIISASNTSISGALRMLNVPDSVFEQEQIARVRPALVLRKDDELVRLLRIAKDRYRLVLFTNTRRVLAVQAISALGFALEDFDFVVAGGDFEDPKPSTASLHEIVRKLNIPAKKCTTIGDRWKVDHEPGVKLGMQAVQVHGRLELVRWLRQQLAC